MELTTALAIWATALSTVLALIKVWETWKSRLRLSTSYCFADLDRGNEIIIENPSGTPVMVSYWELLMVSRSLWKKRIINGRFRTKATATLQYPHIQDMRSRFVNRSTSIGHLRALHRTI